MKSLSNRLLSTTIHASLHVPVLVFVGPRAFDLSWNAHYQRTKATLLHKHTSTLAYKETRSYILISEGTTWREMFSRRNN